MFAVVEKLRVDPQNRIRLIALALEKAAITLGTEPGCRQFDVCSDPSLPETLLLYQLYDHREAFERHVETKHFRSYVLRTSELVKRREVNVFGEVWH